ncbi:MAG TPA: lysophospholipid acyltransferase family protein [Terriglobales bacterium]|nr:lysophospholipid acyltransferase family protein [Terriglobales bacterium]
MSAREQLEYLPVRAALAAMGSLPRRAARGVGRAIAAGFYWGHRRLVRVARRNLEIAFPEMEGSERERIVRELYRNLGRQMAEFCLFPRDRAQALPGLMRTEGLEHYLEARGRGRGVLVLTAHLGAWELSSFGHSLAGFPMKYVVRPLDNRPLNGLVNRYRGMHGNQPIPKGDFARGLLAAMAANETVGILLDQNTYPPQGVFVPFFGKSACTAIGPAKIALRTGAAVVPGFTVWEESERQYVLRFEPALELIRSADEDRDIAANTAAFTQVIERWVRRYPEQWLWVHRRWKARPAGEDSLY